MVTRVYGTTYQFARQHDVIFIAKGEEHTSYSGCGEKQNLPRDISHSPMCVQQSFCQLSEQVSVIFELTGQCTLAITFRTAR